MRDAFEGPQATWTLNRADCGVKLLAQERTYRESHGGQASEHLRLAVGNGTFVYLTQSIGRAPVIAEFRPSLFLKSDRANVQLLARVVFPRSIDRGTGLPITAFLPGDAYTDVGQWQQLSIREADKLVQNEVRAQRSAQFGSSFDPPRPTSICSCSMPIAPRATSTCGSTIWKSRATSTSTTRGPPAVRAGRPALTKRPGGCRDWPHSASSKVRCSWSAGGRSPRVIQHHGEPLEWLKSLGFNTSS